MSTAVLARPKTPNLAGTCRYRKHPTVLYCTVLYRKLDTPFPRRKKKLHVPVSLSLCSTPKRCSSSTTARPRSRKAVDALVSTAWVATSMSTFAVEKSETSRKERECARYLLLNVLKISEFYIVILQQFANVQGFFYNFPAGSSRVPPKNRIKVQNLWPSACPPKFPLVWPCIPGW